MCDLLSQQVAATHQSDCTTAKEQFHCDECIHLVRDVRWEDWDCIHKQREHSAVAHDIDFHRKATRPAWCPLSEEAISNMKNAKTFVKNIEKAIVKLQQAMRAVKTGARVLSDDVTISSVITEEQSETTMATIQKILDDILKERGRQDAEWGGPMHDDGHSPHDWIALIVKHLGKAVFSSAMRFRCQMIRVATLAVAAVEWHDRKEEQ